MSQHLFFFSTQTAKMDSKRCNEHGKNSERKFLSGKKKNTERNDKIRASKRLKSIIFEWKKHVEKWEKVIRRMASLEIERSFYFFLSITYMSMVLLRDNGCAR